eukprot:jgi/Psemu1/26038/gm1.26038_g
MKRIKGRLDRFWVLQYNQSAIHIFRNTMFLANIRKTTKTLELHANTGTAIIDEVGDLPGVGTVQVDYTSRPSKAGLRDKPFRVETPGGSELCFEPDGRGLYYLDCKPYFHMEPNRDQIPITLMNQAISTVEGNKLNFTNRDVKQAEALRLFQHISAHHSDATLIAMTTKNIIKDSPFVPRGMRVARSKEIVDTTETLPLPKIIKEHYKTVVAIAPAGVMHMNQVPFMVTILRHIQYGTIAALPSLKLKELLLEEALMANNMQRTGVNVKVVSREEHIPEIKRYI